MSSIRRSRPEDHVKPEKIPPALVISEQWTGSPDVTLSCVVETPTGERATVSWNKEKGWTLIEEQNG